ncbi:unnamed protein product, partial [Closterium sp. NIES-53]
RGAPRGSVRPMLPDPAIKAAALGASEFSLPGTAPAKALHTFTLDSDASRCFFHDSTTLTPLHATVPVRPADPSRGPVLARSSTVLLCLVVPSGSLSGLHLSSLSTNLVSTTGLQDGMVTTTAPGGQRLSIYSCTRTGRHMAMFTRRPGSSLYTLTTEPPQVAASAQVSASGVSQVDPLPGTVPVDVAVDSGAARGAAFGGGAFGGAEPASAEPGGAKSEGAESGGAEPGGAEPGVTEPKGAEPGGAESEGAESGGAEPWGTTSAIGAGGSAVGGTGAGGAGATSLGGAEVTIGAGGTGGTVAAGPRGARARARGAGDGDPRAGASGAGGTGAGGAGAGGAGGTGAGAGGAGAGDTRAGDPGAGGTGTGGAGAGGAGAGDPGAGGTSAGGASLSLPPPDSVLCQVLSLPSSTGLPPSLLSPPPHQLQPQLQPDSPLPAPSPCAEQADSFTEHREPKSHHASPVRTVRTGRRVPRPRPPPIPGTHIMALRPSSDPLRVPLPPPPLSSLPTVLDAESDLARATTPTISRLLATVVTDPSFESTAASALVAEDFESFSSAVLYLEAMLLAPERDPDAPDISTTRSYTETITGPYSSQWQTAMDTEIASWKSTCTYVDAVPPSGANIVDGMWIFRVKRPPGSPPVFKARYVARGFSQRQRVDFFHNFFHN